VTSCASSIAGICGADVRIAFMGSPAFAVPALDALLGRHEVALVVTQPDKPAGRGKRLAAPAVKQAAQRAGVPVFQPASARDPELLARLRALAPDACAVVAYGKILPAGVLEVPRLGCLNIHASLLPKYRGAAPIQWAILRGETRTGVTIMRVDAGMDTGPTLLAHEVAIAPEDTAGTLHDRLAPIGAALLLEALDGLERGTLAAVPQDEAAATYAPMLRKQDGAVDWERSAAEVSGRIRGVDPWPGAYAQLDGEVIKLFGAVAAGGGGEPGRVIAVGEAGIRVACGTGAVVVRELQAPGKRRLRAAEFWAGRRLDTEIRLGPGAEPASVTVSATATATGTDSDPDPDP
jgi:methionyl-tRNA formyltransferase